ncbi:MAG TPA: secretin N-terminal domain-containing protein [Gammaproteobacteria bacterium]|nr:secretin N-terminal domain-containing protein [Gammaproteobacteria bacterium]
MRRAWLAGWLGAACLLGGCAADPAAPPAPAPPAAQAPAPAHGPPAVPPAVSDALLPPLDIAGGGGPAPGGGASGPRFDVSAVDLPAGQFFMSLVDGTPYNVVVHPGVAGRVSLNLKGVTVPRVMRLVRDIYGYEYERDGNLYKVFPPRVHSRIFQVSYLDVKRRGDSRLRVGGADGTVDTRSEADFWKDLEGTLAGMLGHGGGRKVTVNPGAGMVMVQAYPAGLRRVGRYLAAIQRAARRSVQLEAKVLEVRLNERSQAGIDWGAVAPAGAAGKATGTSSGGGTLALARHDFAPLIRALGSQGQVRVLSSPRLSTLNNQKAVIKAGTDEFFVTDVPGPGARGVTLRPFFSGIALEVTPQISAKGGVMLHLHPAVSEVRDQTKSFTVADKTEELPLALSSIRESDSVIRTKSGQVVMIGGMLQDRSTPEESVVPVLGHIPLLGRLFRHTRHVESRSELVILLRPTVVGQPVRESTRPRDGPRNIAEGAH